MVSNVYMYTFVSAYHTEDNLSTPVENAFIFIQYVAAIPKPEIVSLVGCS